MNEKLEYAGVESVIKKLELISSKMSEILETTKIDMQKVNTKEYWSSPAAEVTINTFLESASKFDKFPKEVLSYANHLRTILQQYSSRTSTMTSRLNDTTNTYVNEIK